jgi:hypothetical protein
MVIGVCLNVLTSVTQCVERAYQDGLEPEVRGDKFQEYVEREIMI